MSVDVVWYGERVIVNALVTDLRSKPDSDRLAAIKALLGAIGVADGRKAAAAWEWIGQITSVKFLVELNCGQFGSPDLIVACETASRGPQVVFLEAKIVPYLGSAMPNSSGARRGFNSAINGQIALKYRLAAALTGPPWSHALAESQDLHRAYSERLDTSDQPRRLEKGAVLDQLKRLPHAAEDRQRFHFVAWTRDREPFWNQQAVTTDLYPCLLNDRNECQWSNDRCRVGWLGFEQVGHVHPGSTYSL